MILYANNQTCQLFELFVFEDILLAVFQVEREHFYARISEGNQLYQELVTSKVPEANNSLKELSIRVSKDRDM